MCLVRVSGGTNKLRKKKTNGGRSAIDMPVSKWRSRVGESWCLGRGRVALLVVSLALLTISTSLTSGQGSGGDGSTCQDETGSGCDSLYVIYAEETDNGVGIYSASEKSPCHEITLLANHSLPTIDCGPDFLHCELTCFACGEEHKLCCTMPVVNSTGKNFLALLQLQQPVSDDSKFQLVDCSIMPTNADCVAARVFSRPPKLNPDIEHFVACINTTDGASSYAWFLPLVFNASDISGTSQLKTEPLQTSEYRRLYSPLSLSKLLHVEVSNSRSGCEASGNVFFVANGLVSTLRVDAEAPAFTDSNGDTIAECTHPVDIAYLQRDELLLRVQCSDNIMNVFTPCGTRSVIETYDSRIDGTIYQCTNFKEDLHLDLTLQDDLLNVTSTNNPDVLVHLIPSQQFPFTANISHAFCEADDDISFVFMLRNGSIFSLSLATGELYAITRNSCNSSSNQCYRARRTGINNTIAAYDYQDSSFLFFNISCPAEPVVVRIPKYPLPPLAAYVQVVTGDEANLCRCRISNDDRTSSLIEPLFSSTVITHSMTTSRAPTSILLMTNAVSQQLSSTVLRTSASPTSGFPTTTTAKQQLSKAAVGSIVGGVCLFIIVIIIIFTVVLFYKKRKKSHQVMRHDDTELPVVSINGEVKNAPEGNASVESSAMDTGPSSTHQDPASSPEVMPPDGMEATGGLKSHLLPSDQSSEFNCTSSREEHNISNPNALAITHPMPQLTKTDQPLLETASSSKTDQPLLETASSSSKTDQPLLETASSSSKTDQPLLETASSSSKTDQPLLETASSPTCMISARSRSSSTECLQEQGSRSNSECVTSGSLTNQTGASADHLIGTSIHGNLPTPTEESGNNSNTNTEEPVTGVPLPISNRRQQQQQQQQNLQQQQQNPQQQNQQSHLRHDPSTGQST